MSEEENDHEEGSSEEDDESDNEAEEGEGVAELCAHFPQCKLGERCCYLHPAAYFAEFKGEETPMSPRRGEQLRVLARSSSEREIIALRSTGEICSINPGFVLSPTKAIGSLWMPKNEQVVQLISFVTGMVGACCSPLKAIDRDFAVLVSAQIPEHVMSPVALAVLRVQPALHGGTCWRVEQEGSDFAFSLRAVGVNARQGYLHAEAAASLYPGRYVFMYAAPNPL